jgi:GT2 family glycosyltransferase
MAIIDIVTLNYKRADLTIDCLQSVLAETKCNSVRLIVVDNGSQDGSAEAIRAAVPEANVIENAENTGFARGNNIGLAHRRGDYVVVLNNDTVVLDGAIDKLVAFMDSHTDAGACGPLHVWPDGSIQYSAGLLPNVWRRFLFYFQLERLVPRSARRSMLRWCGPLLGRQIRSYLQATQGEWAGQTREVEICSASCLVLRPKVLDDVGVFDEAFFFDFEHYDLSIRIRNAGWKIYFVPQARIIHFAAQTAKVHRFAFVESNKASLLYFAKHHSTTELLLVKLIMIFALIGKLAWALVRRQTHTDPTERVACEEAIAAYSEVLRLAFTYHVEPQRRGGWSPAER